MESAWYPGHSTRTLCRRRRVPCVFYIVSQDCDFVKNFFRSRRKWCKFDTVSLKLSRPRLDALPVVTGTPSLDCVNILPYLPGFVKRYFRLRWKCFLTLTRWEPFCGCSSRLRLHAPFSASLCPSSPLAVAVGGHGLACPGFPGGFLTCSAVSILMRFGRCIPVGPGNGLRV